MPEPMGEFLSQPSVQESIPPQIELRSLYEKERESIKNLYSTVSDWHGTGRYHYDDKGNVVDVLDGIAQHGLQPSDDHWDTSNAPGKTISLSPNRQYARVYADLHRTPQEDPIYENKSSVFWARRFFLDSVLKTRNYKGNKDILKSNRLPSPHTFIENLKKWSGKVNKGKVTPGLKTLTSRSDIPDNYPILIGVQEHSFTPISIAPYLQAHETRTRDTIESLKLHLEVPYNHVEETKEKLKALGSDLPVLPVELGEMYSAEFNTGELMQNTVFSEQHVKAPPKKTILDSIIQFIPFNGFLSKIR